MDKDSNVFSAQVLNRHQDNLDLLFMTELRKRHRVLNEKTKHVDVTDNLTFER
jgi:dipeptidyl-peptidase-4